MGIAGKAVHSWTKVSFLYEKGVKVSSFPRFLGLQWKGIAMSTFIVLSKANV